MNSTSIAQFLRTNWGWCLFGVLLLMVFAPGGNSGQIDNTSGGVADIAAVSTGSDLATQWQQQLAGSRLHYFHTYRSYSGGFSRVQKLDLCPQGTYAFYSEASSDMSGPLTESGTWRVEETAGTVQLILTPEGGEPYRHNLAMNAKEHIVLGGREYMSGKEGKYAPNCN